MTESKFAVIGLGRFGMAIAQTLSQRGAEVLAIDNREEKVEEIKDEVAYAVCLDSTDAKALKAQNIKDMDAVVVAIGENFEALLLTTVLLKELEVKRIVVRASGKHQVQILEKLGIEEILSPENRVGIAIAEQLLNPSIVTSLQLPDNYEIVEIKTPKELTNRTLTEIGLRAKYNLNLITLKREFQIKKNGVMDTETHILGVPSSETVLYDSDTIIVFGKSKDIERFIEINQ